MCQKFPFIGELVLKHNLGVASECVHLVPLQGDLPIWLDEQAFFHLVMTSCLATWSSAPCTVQTHWMCMHSLHFLITGIYFSSPRPKLEVLY